MSDIHWQLEVVIKGPEDNYSKYEHTYRRPGHSSRAAVTNNGLGRVLSSRPNSWFISASFSSQAPEYWVYLYISYQQSCDMQHTYSATYAVPIPCAEAYIRTLIQFSWL